MTTERVDGRVAYEQVMEDLRRLDSLSINRRNLFPRPSFHWGEEGYGIVLTEGLVFVSSEASFSLRHVEEEIIVDTGGWLVQPNWERWCVADCIPDDKMNEVIAVVRQAREAAEVTMNKL